MDLGLGTAVATGLGVYYVYGEKGKVAAASAILTGIALYGAYYYKLKCNPKLASVFNGKNGQSNSYGWKPLAKDDIQYVRNVVNNDGIEMVSEP